MAYTVPKKEAEILSDEVIQSEAGSDAILARIEKRYEGHLQVQLPLAIEAFIVSASRSPPGLCSDNMFVVLCFEWSVCLNIVL